MTDLKISVVGGDKRIVEVIKILREKGFDVSVWGIDDAYISPLLCKNNCEEAVSNADIVVLPTPPSEDEVRVNCPLFSKESGIKLHKLLELLPEKSVVMGGRMSPRLRDFAAQRGLKAFDYFNREELLVKNAVPTAEGAIGIAIEKSPKTLFGAEIAILGFGRIGESLAYRLKGLGAKITVYARKGASVAKAESEGMVGAKICYRNGASSLSELTKGYDIIYNTIPYWVVTEDIIQNMPKSTLIIDLASAPGGFDIVAAKKYDVEIIHALALPSKTAPASAGAIIADSILNIITEELTV